MNIVNQTSENSPTGVFHLATSGTFVPADADHPERVNDLPAFYYWKDAIVVGCYVHPAGRFSLDITRDRLDGFVNNFHRMKDNGVGVPILMDHAATASSTLGWIVDVKREGDGLFELHQFLGEEARDIGLRNKVSLGIDPHFVDGRGNQYGEAIVHSAVTPVPVVPDQGEFVALGSGIGVPPMEEAGSPPIELILKSPARKELAATRLSSSKSKAASPLSSEVDLQNALHQVAIMKRDLALARGGVNAAVAAELFELLVGSGELLTLSRTATGVPIALAVFDALSRNHPLALGESTGLQVLSRAVPGEDGAIGDLRERMIALASGK